MEQEIFNRFDAGWVPSDNRVNGRQNGLLQMNNLELDENGALVLCGGTAKIGSAYSNGAHTLASLYTNNTKSRYLMDNVGKIFRNGVEIASGGSTAIGAVGAAFEYAILLSGAKRLFPRPNGRGPIEAIKPHTMGRPNPKFPRPNGRGPIEA